MNDVSDAYEPPTSPPARRLSKWAIFGGLALLLVLIVPLVRSAMQVSQNRTRSSNMLKQLGKAMEMYQSASDKKLNDKK